MGAKQGSTAGGGQSAAACRCVAARGQSSPHAAGWRLHAPLTVSPSSSSSPPPIWMPSPAGDLRRPTGSPSQPNQPSSPLRSPPPPSAEPPRHGTFCAPPNASASRSANVVRFVRLGRSSALGPRRDGESGWRSPATSSAADGWERLALDGGGGDSECAPSALDDLPRSRRLGAPLRMPRSAVVASPAVSPVAAAVPTGA